MFMAIQTRGGFLGATFNVLGEATRYCVLMIADGHHLLPGAQPRLRPDRRRRHPAGHSDDPERPDGLRLASPPVQAVDLAPLPPAVSSARAPAQQTPPARLSAAAGALGARATGAAASGAGAVGRQGYELARTAAYKLAALRGRK